MYAKCFYTDVLTWMMKSHAMDDSEIYDDDDDDDETKPKIVSDWRGVENASLET